VQLVSVLRRSVVHVSVVNKWVANVHPLATLPAQELAESKLEDRVQQLATSVVQELVVQQLATSAVPERMVQRLATSV
jgi:hypothetical protein